MDWFVTETDSLIETRYVELGRLRAQQGVPFSYLFWAVCITRDFLCDYIQKECLIDEPVEFWGGVKLLRSLNELFDRAVYFSLAGYQNAGAHQIRQFSRFLTAGLGRPEKPWCKTSRDSDATHYHNLDDQDQRIG